MGDHGSPAEPPLASEPTWMPPVGYVTISEEHNVATAAGGGTQDANCEAPERMSPTYCRHNVYHTDSKILYRLKRFLCTKRKIRSPSCSLKRFLGTICSKMDCQCSRECRRRSVPNRSGASQFARWAPPPVGYEAWALTTGLNIGYQKSEYQDS